MALQHLRSSTANKRPNPTIISDGQIALNTNDGSPGLFFKDSNSGLVKAGPVHVGATAPNVSPAGTSGNSKGEMWLDTSVTPNELKTWNGSAWVSSLPTEVPVAKLQDGSARQLLQTAANGDDVEWTSNVDIPGTLDVTGAATLDSTLSVSSTATAASFIPSSSSVPTNGVYLPAANSVAVATNGTGRLFVSADGKVGIGTGAPATLLDARGTLSVTTNQKFVQFNDGTSDVARLTYATPGQFVIDANGPSTQSTQFWINGSERARVDSSGRLLVGTSSAVSVGGNFGATTGKSILIETADVATYTAICTKSDGTGAAIALGKSRSGVIVSNGDSLGTVRFAGFDGTDYETEGARIAAFVDGTPGANDMPGRLVFSTTPDDASSPTERMRITSAGNVGIGTTSFGTSAAAVLALGNGTEPTTGPADSVQIYSVDSSAGNTTLGIRTEGNAVATETVTSNRTFLIRINGTTYKLLLATV